MRRQRFFERPTEKSLQHLLECAPAGLALGLARRVYNLAAVLAAPQMSFVFQDVHHSSDRHRGRRRGNCFDDLVDRRLPQCKDRIHNLPLAAAQLRRFGHHQFLR